MNNQSVKRLIGGLGTALILLISAALIGGYFLTERNLQRIDVSEYVDVRSDGAGGYDFTLNIERMLYAEHLIDPPDAELDRYPEIRALKTLGVRANEQDGMYALETISTSSDESGFGAALKAGGLKLTNTQWTWTKAQVEAKRAEGVRGLKLRFSDYVKTERRSDGSFTAALDTAQLFLDAGIDPHADPAADPGARALQSLGVSCTKNADGYLIQATSTSPTITEDLSAVGLQIQNTQWTWTETEMEAHLGTVETPVPESPAPETDAPAQTPEASADTPDTPEPTQEAAAETPEPSATPEPDKQARNANAITSLYGFDQTELRKAIRAAKEAHYGSRFESGSVKYNYFAVGSDSTPHTNVFRLVYAITTSSGTEYLIADVYDLELETGYAQSDVHLKTETDRSKAKSTDDLKGYTVHALDGGSMVFAENKDKSPFNGDGLVMPKSMSEKLTYDELWDIPQTGDMTLLQLLGYARNEMFARGGHKFGDSSNYYKYFSKFDWYQPTGAVTADDLAAKYPATQKNITVIKFLEKLIKEG